MKKATDIKTVAVLGCGFIGFSWAIVFSRNGIEVNLYNRPGKSYDMALEKIRNGLEFLAAEGMIAKDIVKEAICRVHLFDSMEEALVGADYVQECLPEDLELKQEMYRKISALTTADVAIGSSCSGLKISDIAAQVTHNPERCIVAHPTNPPHLIPFMEISGDNASPEAKESIYQFMEIMGQKPILCKEVYAYVLNRLQLALIQEALYLVKENICTVEGVERAITDGLGLRWAFTGPYGVEELNSASLREGLEKYKEYMLLGFSQLGKINAYDDAFVEKAVEGFAPVLNGKSHKEYLHWRDRMVTNTRILKAKNQ